MQKILVMGKERRKLGRERREREDSQTQVFNNYKYESLLQFIL